MSKLSAIDLEIHKEHYHELVRKAVCENNVELEHACQLVLHLIEDLEESERRSPSEPQAHPAPVSKEPGEAVLNTKMLAILQRLEDWGVHEDKMFTETREKTLFKLISDAQTVLHEAKP